MKPDNPLTALGKTTTRKRSYIPIIKMTCWKAMYRP